MKILEAILNWVMPEIKKLFPNDGDFNGLMLLWPPPMG